MGEFESGDTMNYNLDNDLGQYGTAMVPEWLQNWCMCRNPERCKRCLSCHKCGKDIR